MIQLTKQTIIGPLLGLTYPTSRDRLSNSFSARWIMKDDGKAEESQGPTRGENLEDLI